MTWEVDPQVQDTLGVIGTLTAVLLFISPYNTFKRIVAVKSTEEFSPFPYVSTVLNCSVWVFYALPSITPNRTSPLVTNLIGIVFQVVYISLFIRYAREKPRQYVLKLMGGYAVFMVLLVALVMGVLPPEARSPTVGYFAMAFTVVMFAAPLSALAVVLKTRSVEFMPLPLSLMGFACSTSWTVYGLYVQDVFVILPNLFGMALGVVQLVLLFFMSRFGAQRKAAHGDGGPEQGFSEQEILLTEVGGKSAED